MAIIEPHWTVVLRGSFWLPHLINVLDQYKGNSEQRSCADEMIAQIREQMVNPNVVGKETTKTFAVIDPVEIADKVDCPAPEAARYIARLLREVDENNGVPTLGRLADAFDPTPQIEEPTGLGAVVEDVDGVRWVRIDDPPSIWAASRSDGDRGMWSTINAVRVLSKGEPA